MYFDSACFSLEAKDKGIEPTSLPDKQQDTHGDDQLQDLPPLPINRYDDLPEPPPIPIQLSDTEAIPSPSARLSPPASPTKIAHRLSPLVHSPSDPLLMAPHGGLASVHSKYQESGAINVCILQMTYETSGV